MKYKFLEDIAIADIAFEAYGKNLNEVFANAALAVSDTIFDLKTVEHNETKIIELEEKQIDLLLFDFLAEVIFIKDAENLLLNKFDVKIEENKINKLKCIAFGEKINREKHELRNDVKAVTMHMFEVKKEKAGWKATVIIDI